MAEPPRAAAPEGHEVALVARHDMPWRELAFAGVRWPLGHCRGNRQCAPPPK